MRSRREEGRLNINERLRRSAAIVVLILGVLAGAVAPASAATPSTAAAITLQPNVGPPTTKVAIDGSSFGASEVIVIHFDATKLTVSPTTNGTGAFSATFRVPKAATPGNHTVKARGQTSGKVASATFTVRTNWAMAHFDVANTGNNPYENVLSAANVGNLAAAGTGMTNNPGGSPGGGPVVVNGVVYMTSWYGQVPGPGTQLSAFSASCLQQASNTCQPLWQAPALQEDIAVANGVVYVAGSGGLYAYSATADSKFCGGTPKQCNPMWVGISDGTVGHGPIVANGTIYFPSGNTLYAFNPGAPGGGGPGKCHGTYPHKTCMPLWSTSVGTAMNSCCFIRGIAIEKPASPPPGCATPCSVAYLSAGQLYALDASNGSMLWATNDGQYPPATNGSPSVGGGAVYSSQGGGILSAFDTSAPEANCSGTSPRICTAAWRAGTGYSGTTPTIADGMIYTTVPGYLYAFDASAANCKVISGAKWCAPVWQSKPSIGVGTGAPAVANGVVYAGGSTGTLVAFATTLNGGCVGTPIPSCNALFSGSTTNVVFTPVIADGVVYAANGNSSMVTAFHLP
jgi:hypothetical protein